MKIRAIVGLGNPGPSYVYTRHNIGFRVLDALAAEQGATWQHNKELLYTSVQINDTTIFLIKPMTGMNCSGVAIPYLKKKGVEPIQVLVVHDELELPFGKITVKCGGSAKGHNGLRSLISAWGSAEFWRMRCGIGRPIDKDDVPRYVLSTFSESAEEVAQLIAAAQKQLEILLAE